MALPPGTKNQNDFFNGIATFLNEVPNGIGRTRLGQIIFDNNFDPLPLSVDEGKDNTYDGVCVTKWPPPFFFSCPKHYGVRGRCSGVTGLSNITVAVNTTDTAFANKTGFYKCNDMYFLDLNLTVTLGNLNIAGGYTLYMQDIPDINQSFTVVATGVQVNITMLIGVAQYQGESWGGYAEPQYNKIDTITKISIGSITYPDYPGGGIAGQILSFCRPLFQPVIDLAFGIVRTKVQEAINGPINNILKSKITELIANNPTVCPRFLFLDPTTLINSCIHTYTFDPEDCEGVGKELCPQQKLTIEECNALVVLQNQAVNNLGVSRTYSCTPGSYVTSPDGTDFKPWLVALVALLAVFMLIVAMRGSRIRY